MLVLRSEEPKGDISVEGKKAFGWEEGAGADLEDDLEMREGEMDDMFWNDRNACKSDTSTTSVSRHLMSILEVVSNE